jgi:hypothetical protein
MEELLPLNALYLECGKCTLGEEETGQINNAQIFIAGDGKVY